MARVTIKHEGIKDDDATVPPKRDPVPEGNYNALIVAAHQSATSSSPPLAKVAVQFQIVSRLADEGQEAPPPDAEKDAGRRVFQDYIIEPDPTMPQMNDQRKYELRCLLDAAKVDFDDTGFDTDDLLNKPVKIKVRHRRGTKVDPDTNELPIFTNVRKVESLEEISSDDLV